jgi:peptidoglycan/xylan/chitin deacetylase (PgdA/CDA1 family)
MVVDLLGRFNRTIARIAPVKSAPYAPRGPMVSITFDDFPKSAWTNARPVLERHDALATYYVAGRFCGIREKGLEYYDRSDLSQLAAAGHEIGCHTFSHIHVPRMTNGEFRADCALNARFLAPHLAGRVIESFAYPYGDVSVRAKMLAARRFVTARGIHPQVNASPLDLALLASMPLESRSWSIGEWRRLVSEAAQNNGWLTLFVHDVSEEPTRHGCTPDMLDLTLRTARDQGLAILTVGAAAARLLARPLAKAA